MKKEEIIKIQEKRIRSLEYDLKEEKKNVKLILDAFRESHVPLRDQFAMAAVQGCLSREEYSFDGESIEDEIDLIIEISYKFADAAMKERAK